MLTTSLAAQLSCCNRPRRTPKSPQAANRGISKLEPPARRHCHCHCHCHAYYIISYLYIAGKTLGQEDTDSIRNLSVSKPRVSYKCTRPPRAGGTIVGAGRTGRCSPPLSPVRSHQTPPGRNVCFWGLHPSPSPISAKGLSGPNARPNPSSYERENEREGARTGRAMSDTYDIILNARSWGPPFINLTDAVPALQS